jgi:hypothetical protein
VFETAKHRIRPLRRILFCRSLGIRQSVKVSDDGTPVGIYPTLKSKLPRGVVRLIVKRPGGMSLAPGPLLLGCQVGLEPNTFADLTNDRWGRSTPMIRSPHVELLRSALSANRALSDDEIMSTNYWKFAQDLLEISGDFFGMKSDHDVLGVVRNFIEWGLGESTRVTLSGGSRIEDGVLVARVPGCAKFQIIDGHHRVAVAILKGEATIPVRRTWLSTGVPDYVE